MRHIFLAAALLLTGIASADLHTETVEYTHGGITFQGVLSYDDTIKQKRPAVIVIHEWWGLNDHPTRIAGELAEIGYVGFAADVYGKDKVTTDSKQAGEWAGALKSDRGLLRERVNAAIEAVKMNSKVDTGNIAVIGYCFGGTAALEVARSGADIKGAVSLHGSLDTPNPADAKNIKAKILVLHGGDDPMVPADQVKAFTEEMRNAGVNWQLNAYGGAVHAFTNPAAGKDNSKGVAYNEQADRRSWQALEQFLDEIFEREIMPKSTSSMIGLRSALADWHVNN